MLALELGADHPPDLVLLVGVRRATGTGSPRRQSSASAAMVLRRGAVGRIAHAGVVVPELDDDVAVGAGHDRCVELALGEHEDRAALGHGMLNTSPTRWAVLPTSTHDRAVICPVLAASGSVVRREAPRRAQRAARARRPAAATRRCRGSASRSSGSPVAQVGERGGGGDLPGSGRRLQRDHAPSVPRDGDVPLGFAEARLAEPGRSRSVTP